VTTSLRDFPAGHNFEPITITTDVDRVRAYIDATEDACAIYDEEDVVPPLALAAFALGALLSDVGLPPGTLHVNETIEFRAAVPVGAKVECHARLAQRSQRGGVIVSAIDSDLRVAGETVLTARATVFSPVDGL
jgi:hypothetical protein